MTEWHYADNQRQTQGPLSAEQLRTRLEQQEIDRGTLVWCPGMPEWQPLERCADALGLALPPTLLKAEARVETWIEPSPAPLAPSTAPATLPIANGEVIEAGLWRRVAAAIIDSTLVSLASYALLLPLIPVFGVVKAALATDRPAIAVGIWLLSFAVVIALCIGLPAAYFGWMQSTRRQATLGKLAVGIKVVRGDGTRIDFWRGFLRYLAQFLLGALTFGISTLVSGFMVGLNPRKQALHDLICDTRVVDCWAYTDQSERQQRGLDTTTKVILVIYAALLALIVILSAVIIGGVAATAASGALST